MGVERKESVSVSRTEAVQRIRALLDQLDHGSVTVGDQTFAVPEHLQLKMKVETDELDLELKW